MAAVAGEAVEVGADFLQKVNKLNVHTCGSTSLKMIQTPRLSVGLRAAALKYDKNNTSTMLNHLKMKHPLPTASTSSNCWTTPLSATFLHNG